jgi:hypothetical protein
MWRAVSEGAPFLSGRTMIMAGHSARQLVVYPSPGGTKRRAKR